MNSEFVCSATSMQTETPQQSPTPLALVHGQPILHVPQDLYIPPDALEVFLDAFEGPLDLLLYLIRRQNVDILDIPIAQITQQYVAYINVMQELRFELAAEYLVMAAILAEIKSRLLLPRPVDLPEEEDDPRAELVRRLKEYELCKKAAETLDTLTRLERDTAVVCMVVDNITVRRIPPPVCLDDISAALRGVLQRAELFTGHCIQREVLTVRQRMSDVLSQLSSGGCRRFDTLFLRSEGKYGVLVTFLALLELAKEQMVDLIQDAPFSPIFVKSLSKSSSGRHIEVGCAMLETEETHV